MSGSAAGLGAPSEVRLPESPDTVAPDGSAVRLLSSLPGASMAHFELGAGKIAIAQRHRTVSEIWYVLTGHGRMWRRGPGGDTSEIELVAGVSLTIPVGTVFQFRADGDTALTVVGVTLPPWPGPDEAVRSNGIWEPVL